MTDTIAVRCRSTPPHGQRSTFGFATLADAPPVRAIYNVEVNEYTSTFDLVPRTLDQQRTWLAERSGAFSAVVATLDADPGQVVGFAALSPYKEQAAYRTTVENSVYVSASTRGWGSGRP